MYYGLKEFALAPLISPPRLTTGALGGEGGKRKANADA